MPGLGRGQHSVQPQGHPTRPIGRSVLDAIGAFPARKDPETEPGKGVVPEDVVAVTRTRGLDGSLGEIGHDTEPSTEAIRKHVEAYSSVCQRFVEGDESP